VLRAPTASKIQSPSWSYQTCKLKIKDPDGNILWFGTGPLKDVPFDTEPADSRLPRERL
jgi:hypothetical protein